MRIRRKKHLQERKDAVGNLLLTADFDIKNSFEAIKDKKYFDLENLFGNNNPVCLEIGCGKGLFVCETAKRNQDKNYIAVELLDNIIVMACERSKDYNITNVRFFNCGADYLPRYLPDESIKCIYLNFSPPFPGDRYENRRLTCDRLMEYYGKMLTSDGEIQLKTDDREFFEYSFTQAVKFGYNVVKVDVEKDLLNKDYVKTEYELKFNKEGKPIHKFIAKKI